MPIPPELATARADVASATAADTVGGRRAPYVAAPASTEEASALLRAAAALGLTVVSRGAGRLQHWGNPPDSCDLIVDTRRLDRVIEHRRAVVVYAPDEVRNLTDMHGPVPSLALMRAVGDEFDPEHRMAPGRVADLV